VRQSRSKNPHGSKVQDIFFSLYFYFILLQRQLFINHILRFSARVSCASFPFTPCRMNREYPSDQAENESALFNYDSSVPSYTQPTEFHFPEIPLPGHDDLATGDQPNTKVPIARNLQPISWASSGRVSRACENCQEQKAKCSGHRPVCLRCKDASVRCSYSDRKREKMAKWVASDGATAHI
jgi:hypothetical protein